MKKISVLIGMTVLGALVVLSQKSTTKGMSPEALPMPLATTAIPSGQSQAGIDHAVAQSEQKTWEEKLSLTEDLQNKVLRDEKDIKILTSIYGTRANIDRAKSHIQHVEAEDLKANQKIRMRNILFLMHALEFSANPERGYVVSTLEDVLSGANIDGYASSAVKKSVAGDHIELFAILKKHSPVQALAIEEAADATHKKLYQYADQFYGLAKKEN